MRTFCELQDDPMFQFLVDGLRDQLGDRAEYEAARDYLDTGGFIRTPDEVLEKLSKDLFNILEYKKATQVKEVTGEGVGAFKKLVKLNGNSPVSGLNKALINGRVKMANGKLGTSYYIKFTQVGESDNFIPEVIDAKKQSSSTVSYFRDTVGTSEQFILDNVMDADNTTLDTSELAQARSAEIVSKLMGVLHGKLGVQYQIITPQQAVEITKNSKNPYSGEKCLYYGDTVYFVGDNMSIEAVFHEFSHPFVRAVYRQNQPLFDKLYSDFIGSEEGESVSQQVKELYPETNEDSYDYKEEVLVRGLSAKAGGIYEGKSKVSRLFDNLLYAIKQMLRKVFGAGINISNLDTNTSLNQLAEMLASSDTFSINTEDTISEDDVVAYMRDRKSYINDLTKLSKPELEKLTNDFFDKVKLQLSKVKKDGNYSAMLDILSNQYKSGELQKIVENLKPYQTKILEDMATYEDEVTRTQSNVNALLNSLFHIQNLTEKVKDRLYEITKDVDNQDNLQQAFYAKQLLSHWGSFMENADKQLSANGVRSNDPIAELIASINHTIKRGNDAVEEIYEKGAKDVLVKELQLTADNIDTKYNEMLKSLTDKNAPQKVIDKLKKEYEEARLTPEKIEKALKGQLKDISSIGALMESYTYNPDPVVGGLASYVKSNMTDVLAKIQSQFNDFADGTKKMLEDIDYNPNHVGRLGRQIGFEDEVGTTDDNGDFRVMKVWRFLNEFKGHDKVRDEYRFKIRKASEQYTKSQSEEDKKVLYDLQQEWQQHNKDFWNQEYVDKFYERFELLKKDDIGIEASNIRDQIFDQVQLLKDTPTDSAEDLEVGDKIEELFRELRRHSDIRNNSGRLKTGRELLIAQRLKEFSEVAKEFYDWQEIPEAFQEAYNNFEQQLVDEGHGRGSESFNKLMDGWLDRNTRKVAKQEFWDELSEISSRINAIMESVPEDVRAGLSIKDYLDSLKEALKGYRDEDGQPLGGEMNDDRIKMVKDIHVAMNKAQEKLNGLLGMTKSESYELSMLMEEQLNKGPKTSQSTKDRIAELLKKESELPLNVYQRAELVGLFEAMNQLRRKDPTDSYIDVVNGFLSTIEGGISFKNFQASSINADNAWMVLKDSVVNDLFEQSPEFKDWFKKNHIRKSSFDPNTGQEAEKWERIYAWNVMRPNNPAHYESTTITNNRGQSQVIQGLPSLRYFKRIVKDEFKTEKIVGKTVDNTGNWLPRTIQQGAKDDRYINKDFDKLRKSDPKIFKVLEEFKKKSLQYQEGADPKAKLWLDMPRYRMDWIERYQTDSVFQRTVMKIKTFWTQIKDGFDNGFNFSDDNNLVKLDMWDDETSGVPIQGLSKIESSEVSTDIAYTLMRYMASIERQKKLIEISPTVRAIQSTVNNKQNFPFVEKSMKNRTFVFSNKTKDKYVRAQAVNNFIDREFEGKYNTGVGSENPLAQNLSKFLFKRASFAYMALNIPSAVYNTVNAKFQGMIEASAGKYYNHRSFLKAEPWAFKTTGEISLSLYDRSSKGLNVQMVELFDPDNGRFEANVGESLSRTALKDTADIMERTGDFRRWTQLQTSVQLFGAMLEFQQIKKSDGSYISYMDAWELRDGKIQLKEGIDPEWGITYDEVGNMNVGSKFKAKKAQMQNVIGNINGAMSREDSPEANRYLLGRYLLFFRRYFTSMFMNRFAYSGSIRNGLGGLSGRYNYQLGDSKEGYYVTGLKFMSNVFKTYGKYLPHATTTEKAAMFRIITEMGGLIMTSLLIPSLFGYDEDDKDRFKKLKAKSGALPMFGVKDDPNNPFRFGGWISNHALLTALHIRGENESMLPFPGFGINDFKKYTDIKSIVFGSTLNSWYNTTNDLYYMATGDEKAYYKRKANAFEWGEKGDSKLWSHLLTSLGITGNTTDPAEAVKKYETARNRNY